MFSERARGITEPFRVRSFHAAFILNRSHKNRIASGTPITANAAPNMKLPPHSTAKIGYSFGRMLYLYWRARLISSGEHFFKAFRYFSDEAVRDFSSMYAMASATAFGSVISVCSYRLSNISPSSADQIVSIRACIFFRNAALCSSAA